MEQHEYVIDRLRAFGHQRIDPAVAARHLTRLAAEAPLATGRGRRWGRAAVIATAIVGLAGPAAALTLEAATPASPATPATPADPPDTEAVSATPATPATAATTDSAAAGDAEAAVNDPTPEDPCTGPPPFAGIPAEPATGDGEPSLRSVEAQEHAAIRQACGGEEAPLAGATEAEDEAQADDTDTEDEDSAGRGAAGERGGGPPESAPAGPPEGAPGGG